MDKFISYEQMNKKQRAALNKQKRQTWDIKPTTKVVPSKKIYNRKKVNTWTY